MSEKFNSLEQKLLVDILFNDKKLEKERFDKINFDKLIKISSSHLIIPALFSNIITKGYKKFFPNDMITYIRNIYQINTNRNRVLIDEINEISKILKKKKVDHVFLKGAALIFGMYYKKIGERMISDIDILVNKNDINKSLNCLKQLNYSGRFKYKIWKTKHQPIQLNKKKLFGVEIHNELVIYRKKNYINKEQFLSRKCTGINNVNIPQIENLLEHVIYNYQINDYGSLKCSYSFRSIYDFKMICDNIDVGKIEFPNNIYFNTFLIVLNELKIKEKNIPINKNLTNWFYLKRIRLKKSFELINIIDNFFCNVLIITPKLTMQIIEFIFNNNYRKSIFNRLKI